VPATLCRPDYEGSLGSQQAPKGSSASSERSRADCPAYLPQIALVRGRRFRDRCESTRRGAARWPRPDGRHSSPSYPDPTNFGVDDMPIAGSLQRRMVSLTSTLRCPKFNILDAFSICVSPSCDLYSRYLGVAMSLWVRFEYSVCNVDHVVCKCAKDTFRSESAVTRGERAPHQPQRGLRI